MKEYVNEMRGAVDKTGNEVDEPDTPSAVMVLTGDDFEHGIENGISIVKFFAPWCGHSKRLVPTWEELGQKFLGIPDVYISKVDCTLESNRQLCSQQEVILQLIAATFLNNCKQTG